MAYERDYDLAILIILLFLCWPAGVIYYFTRPMRPRRYYAAPPPYQPYQPTAGEGPLAYCKYCGTQISPSASFCLNCGGKLK